MGRGLSDLQTSILRLAVELLEFRTEDWKDDVPDVLYAEVMMRHYGFEPEQMPAGCDGMHLRHWSGWRAHGTQFSRESIGAKRYDAAKAAVSRAVRRLEWRGLVFTYSEAKHVRDIYLTPEGWKLANGLPRVK
jgi:hypothetical protein